MKKILLQISCLLALQAQSQLGTTINKPVTENDFQEIKSIVSGINQAAFRMELNVIGANGAIRREVLGGMDMAKLRMDPNTKNFMVNNGGAIGGLRMQRPDGNGMIPSDPSKMNQGQQQRGNNGASQFTQFGKEAGGRNNRPAGFGGAGQSRPGAMGKSEGGGAPADKPDKTGNDNKGGGSNTSDRSGNNPSSHNHNNTPVPANANNYGKPQSEGDKKPEPAKNTNSGGGGSQNTPGNTNTWTGSNPNNNNNGSTNGTPANTWSGSGTSAPSEEEKKKIEMGNLSNPGTGPVNQQARPGTQRMGANQTISFPPNFRQGSFFICDLCSVNLIGQPAMNRLEGILAKYK